MRTKTRVGAILVAALALALSACGTADSGDEAQQSSRYEVPPALANKGLEFSDVNHFIGGGWVYVDTSNRQCDPDTACVNLVVAADPGCRAGFFAVVDFRDEYGDTVGQVRERVMGVGPNVPVEMRVAAPAATQPADARVLRAGCIT